MGDPIFCKGCKVALNCLSIVENQNGNNTDKLWTCEFCKFENILQIDEEEVPKSDDLLYMIQSNN